LVKTVEKSGSTNSYAFVDALTNKFYNAGAGILLVHDVSQKKFGFGSLRLVGENTKSEKC
jgi:hypothetical protein